MNEVCTMADLWHHGRNLQYPQADPQQPNWQEAFYGVNYDRLLAIKGKYDPHGNFYAHTAVGSDKWVQESDGRLCRAGSS